MNIVLARVVFRARRGSWSDLLRSLLLDFLRTYSSSVESPLLSASDPAKEIRTFFYLTTIDIAEKCWEEHHRNEKHDQVKSGATSRPDDLGI